eukprot:364168-Chlamydomonas_euryale.AAC.6
MFGNHVFTYHVDEQVNAWLVGPHNQLCDDTQAVVRVFVVHLKPQAAYMQGFKAPCNLALSEGK